MTTSSFYHDNLFRAYPLEVTDASLGFPTKRIVAAKITCSFGSPYTSFPRVFLTDWEVRSSQHQVHFLCTDGMVQTRLSVSVPRGAEPFTRYDSGDVNETRIRMIVGELADVTESRSNLSLRLEPTCVLWLKHRGIRRIQFANASRPRLRSAIYPGISSERREAYEKALWWCQDQLVQGEPLLFREGSNCLIVISSMENRVLFFPQAGSGIGAVQEFVSLGSTVSLGTRVNEIPEILPEDLALRPDGLPPAEGILYAFGGATGPEISLIPNETIQIRNDRDSSTASIAVVGLHGKGC